MPASPSGSRPVAAAPGRVQAGPVAKGSCNATATATVIRQASVVAGHPDRIAAPDPEVVDTVANAVVNPPTVSAQSSHS